MIYLDGSALCRFLPGVRHGEVWQTWVASHEGQLVTSQLGLTELRQAAALYPRDSIDEITAIIEQVRTDVPVTRFSDDKVSISSHANAVLKPFAALHIGAAVGDERVDTIATYDPALAHVAEIYRLKVVTPGLDEKWYLEFEGPVESWSPIDLDAPFASAGGELKPNQGFKDPFEEALKEMDSAPTPSAADETVFVLDEVDGAASDEAIEPVEPADAKDAEELPHITPVEEPMEETSVPELTKDAPDTEAEPVSRDLKEEPKGVTEPRVPEEASSPPVPAAPSSAAAPPPPAPPPVAATPPAPMAAEPSSAAAPPPPAPPPSAASPSAVGGEEAESEASRRRAEMIAALGVYKPKVKAWDGEEAEGAASVPARSPTPELPKEEAPAQVPLVSRAQPVAETEKAAQPQPESPEPVSAESPVGEPVRRPMLHPEPAAEPKPSAAVPVEAESPQPDDDAIPAPELPPIQVTFEEPISYAPARYDPSGARPLPEAHPFARAGQTAAMEAPPIPPQDVPNLEPAPPSEPPVSVRPIGWQEPEIEMQPEPSKKEEVEDKPSRRRRGKEGKRGKKEEEPPEPTPPPSQAEPEEDEGWKLEDIIGRGVKKGKSKPS